MIGAILKKKKAKKGQEAEMEKHGDGRQCRTFFRQGWVGRGRSSLKVTF